MFIFIHSPWTIVAGGSRCQRACDDAVHIYAQVHMVYCGHDWISCSGHGLHIWWPGPDILWPRQECLVDCRFILVPE